MSARILDFRKIEFLGIEQKAERLRNEASVPALHLTPTARASIDRVIDSLGPIQVLGGSFAVGRIDAWFNPRVLAEEMFTYPNEHRAALFEILNSVVAEFSPGQELTKALGGDDGQPAPMDEALFMKLNSIFDRYADRLVALGSPAASALVRKRMGL